jgi:hypothetical protein
MRKEERQKLPLQSLQPITREKRVVVVVVVRRRRRRRSFICD